MNNQSRLHIVPIDRDDAISYIENHHRHHGYIQRGAKFGLAVADDPGQVRGVALCGKPRARMLNDGWTLEIYRLCTDGCPNACSALYGGCCRVAFAMGYRRVVTYTGTNEPGTSLVASGFKVVGEVKGRSWDCPSRPRVDRAPLQDKFRWEKALPSKSLTTKPTQVF